VQTSKYLTIFEEGCFLLLLLLQSVSARENMADEGSCEAAAVLLSFNVRH